MKILGADTVGTNRQERLIGSLELRFAVWCLWQSNVKCVFCHQIFSMLGELYKHVPSLFRCFSYTHHDTSFCVHFVIKFDWFILYIVLKPRGWAVQTWFVGSWARPSIPFCIVSSGALFWSGGAELGLLFVHTFVLILAPLLWYTWYRLLYTWYPGSTSTTVCTSTWTRSSTRGIILVLYTRVLY